MRTKFFAILIAVLFPAAVFAHDGVHVENAYALETTKEASVGAVFLDIRAMQATENDALLKVVTPIADRAEIHSTTMDDMGVMKMRPLERLVVVKEKVTSLKQGGDHIMLLGLHGPLVAGSTFPLTLTFERGEVIEVLVPVKAMNDPMISPPGDAMQDHGHH